MKEWRVRDINEEGKEWCLKEWNKNLSVYCRLYEEDDDYLCYKIDFITLLSIENWLIKNLDQEKFHIDSNIPTVLFSNKSDSEILIKWWNEKFS